MVSYIKNGKRVIVGGSTEDAVMLEGVFEIAEATDLNTLTTIGNYFKEKTTFAVTNAPDIASGITSKFRMTVEKGLGPESTIIRQTIHMTDGVDFIRAYNGAWREWKEVGSGGGGGSADFPTGGTIGQVLTKNGSGTSDVEWAGGDYYEDTIADARQKVLAGLIPSDGAKVYIPGGDIDVDSAADLPAIDTSGILPIGSEANTQTLLDELADRVADKLLTKASFNQTIENYLKKEDASKLYLEEDKYEDDIRGVNLLKNEATTSTVSGVTFTVNSDGSVTANGTATAAGDFRITVRYGLSGNKLFLKNGNYRATGAPTGGGSESYYVYYIYSSGTSFAQYGVDSGNGLNFTVNGDSNSSDGAYVGIQIHFANGYTFNNAIFNIVVSHADASSDTYYPYNSQSIQKQLNAQGVLGAKNLFPIASLFSTKVVNGITFTLNSDGTVTINGTATGNPSYVSIEGVQNYLEVDTEYIFSGCPATTGTIEYKMLIRDATGGKTLAESDGKSAVIPFKLPNAINRIDVRILVYNGYTVSNVIMKPMIRLASDPDDTYVPYAATNKVLADSVSDLGTRLGAGSFDKIIMAEDTDNPADIATNIKNIITKVAPQSWAKGSYMGTFRNPTAVGNISIYAGYYSLNVFATNANWATQGFVVAQGRFFIVWYRQAEWTVTQIE